MSRNKAVEGKRGIAIGQVFIFMMAAIVFAVVVFFGYSAITDFLDKGEKVAYVTFQNDLEGLFNSMYSDYGTVAVFSGANGFPVPGNYEKICFLDLDYVGDRGSEGICQSTHKDYNPLVCDAWLSLQSWEQGDQNVFLDPIGLGPIKVYKLKVELRGKEQGYYCTPVVQGRADFRLEGKGTHVLISEP